MSSLKKALHQLVQNAEFYATQFLAWPWYQAWQKQAPRDAIEKFTALLQADIHNEQQFTQLLTQQPALIKLILHRDTVSQISPWYQHHPSADFKRQKRQHTALVDTLYILCARYKKQLRRLILTASNGCIGISLDETMLTKETPVLPVTPAQHQQLKRALKHYQATLKLEKALRGDASAQQKLMQFMQAFYAPETQAMLHQHRPFGVMKLFKKRWAIFQFEPGLAKKPLENGSDDPLNQTLLAQLAEQDKKIAL